MPIFSRSFLNSINETGVPPHELHLRDGDICFLTINLSKKAKLMNNTKVEILKVKRRLILIRTVREGTLHFIPRINFNIEVKSRKRNAISFTLRRRKFPFRLCYAMTTDKSQGQQLDRLSLDLRTPCFSHGQLYVAYGRATKRKNVLTLVDEKSRSKSNIDLHYTVNIVHDVLLH